MISVTTIVAKNVTAPAVWDHSPPLAIVTTTSTPTAAANAVVMQQSKTVPAMKDDVAVLIKFLADDQFPRAPRET